MKKLLIALILIVLAGAGGYAYLKYGKTEDKASVTQAAIQSGNIVQAVQATGTLEALRTVQVGSQVSGTVKSLYADFNSIVKKDQIIAELDPSLLQVQVDVQNANISRQEGDIAQQKVNLENDQLTLTRTQAQFDKGLVSPQQLEAAQLAVKSRQANINSLEKQLVQARAQLSQAKLNVSYCTIRSPIDGVVVNRIVDIGTTVQASMTTPQFFTIATDLTTLKLSAGVDEADIGYIRPNMQVTFTVDVVRDQAVHRSRRRGPIERADAEQRRDVPGVDQRPESQPGAAAEHDRESQDHRRPGDERDARSRIRRCASGRRPTSTRGSACSRRRPAAAAAPMRTLMRRAEAARADRTPKMRRPQCRARRRRRPLDVEATPRPRRRALNRARICRRWRAARIQTAGNGSLKIKPRQAAVRGNQAGADSGRGRADLVRDRTASRVRAAGRPAPQGRTRKPAAMPQAVVAGAVAAASAAA